MLYSCCIVILNPIRDCNAPVPKDHNKMDFVGSDMCGEIRGVADRAATWQLDACLPLRDLPGHGCEAVLLGSCLFALFSVGFV